MRDAFGIEEIFSQRAENGAVLHAELRHGNRVLLIGTADLPEGSSGIYLVVEDVEAHHARAMAAGATEVYPPEATT